MQTHTPQLNHWATPGLVTLLLLVLSVPLILTGRWPLQILGGAMLLLGLVMPALGKAMLPHAIATQPDEGGTKTARDNDPPVAEYDDPLAAQPDDFVRSAIIGQILLNEALELANETLHTNKAVSEEQFLTKLSDHLDVMTTKQAVRWYGGWMRRNQREQLEVSKKAAISAAAAIYRREYSQRNPQSSRATPPDDAAGHSNRI